MERRIITNKLVIIMCMDNNEESKKEIEFDDIDENGKITKASKLFNKKEKVKKEEVKERENKNEEKNTNTKVEEKKDEIVYDDIDVNDKIRADEINNETRAKVRKGSKTIVKEILEWVLCFIIAYFLYLIINYFVGTISGVKQVSMLPTTKENDRLIITRPVIFNKELKYGDIVTFEAPLEDDMEKNDNNIASYVEKTGIDSFFYNFMGIGKSSYIKRVIGLPGDHIEIKEDGSIYRNNEKLDEPYLNEQYTNRDTYNDVVVPHGTVFMMGDNRLSSKDSRFFGCVPIEKVNGYVVIRVWPLNKWGKLK